MSAVLGYLCSFTLHDITWLSQWNASCGGRGCFCPSSSLWSSVNHFQ